MLLDARKPHNCLRGSRKPRLKDFVRDMAVVDPSSSHPLRKLCLFGSCSEYTRDSTLHMVCSQICWVCNMSRRPSCNKGLYNYVLYIYIYTTRTTPKGSTVLKSPTFAACRISDSRFNLLATEQFPGACGQCFAQSIRPTGNFASNSGQMLSLDRKEN